MLHVQSFTFNPFQENTYIVFNQNKEAIIIDPGMYDAHEQKYFFDYIDSLELKPQLLLCTHTHLDHIFGVEAVLDRFSIPFAYDMADKVVFDNAAQVSKMYGVPLVQPPAANFYISEGETVQLGTESIQILATPGHSPGSVCFYHSPSQWVISGDVLFQQSIGRTDLPGGDYDTLIHSIRTKLMSLPPDTKVYAGHGPATTIALEAMNNPFLR